MSVGGDVSINLAASMLFEAGKFGIGKIRERRENLAVLVELAKAAQAEGTYLSDSEAERFKHWIQSTELDKLAANALKQDDALAQSIALEVFRIDDPKMAPDGTALTDWKDAELARAEALGRALWPALDAVLTKEERQTIRTELERKHDAAQVASMLFELGWIRGELGKQAQLGDLLTPGLPIERALLRPPTDSKLSPYEMLWPRYGVVPYDDTTGHLAELKTWCESPQRISVQIIFGAGGMGKTRLGLELCAAMGHKGWIAGKYRPDLSRDLTQLVNTKLPRLLVVDYAENQPSNVTTLIDAFAATPPLRANKVRIVLLVRRGSKDARRVFATSQSSASKLIDEREPMSVAPTSGSELAWPLEQRNLLFNQAAAAFCESFETEPASMPDLSADTFRSPFFVCAAAVLLTDPKTAGSPLANSASEILDRLLDRERDRHWSKCPAEAPSDHAVAIATLFGADTKIECAEHLKLIPEMADDSGLRNRCAEWLNGLYEGPRTWVNPLEPDLLGERLVSRYLDTEAIRYALDNPITTSGIRAITVLARVAADPDLRDSIRKAVSKNLGSLADIAFQQEGSSSLTTTGLLCDPLAALVEASSVHGDWINPSYRVGQAGTRLALALNTVEVDRLRALAAQDPATHNEGLAATLNSLSVRQGEAGLRDEALSTNAEAVKIWRVLADRNPEAHILGLTAGLNNLSVRLREAGLLNDALLASAEAVDVCRVLSAQDPSQYPALASSLMNFSSCQGAVGSRDAALLTVAEAVDITRVLSALDPLVYNPVLVKSLMNFSLCQAEVGLRDEALSTVTEAVVMCRLLVAQRPLAFSSDLASLLNILSMCQGEVGLFNAALLTITEAVDVYRALAAQSPLAFSRDLAMSLNNLAVRQGQDGLREESLATIAEAVEIYRFLAAQNPLANNPDLAGSLDNLSLRLGDLGLFDEAVAASAEAVGLYRFLASQNSLAYGANLARSLNNLSLPQGGLGFFDQALETIREAVDLYRDLVMQNPVLYNPVLASSLYNLSLRQGDVGLHHEALATVREAVDLYGVLATQNWMAYQAGLAQALWARSRAERSISEQEN
jgi:tetratricopeptide (TPR) repeat protein